MTETKNENSRGLECYVLDEYVLVTPEVKSTTAEPETGGEVRAKGQGHADSKDKKQRGQNKHRPIFKQNLQVE